MNEKLEDILKHPVTIPAAVGIVSCGLGAAVGYFWATRRYNQTLDKIEEVMKDSDKVLDQLQFDFDVLERAIDEGTLVPVRDVAEEMEHILSEEEIRENFGELLKKDIPKDEPEVGDPFEAVQNVFASTSSEWNYEAELSTRTADSPYVIHKDEFFSDEMGFGQTTLTYYEGDEILVDENDVPLYGFSLITGDLRFGHGSDDPNIVYIRNEKLKGEYEILRDYGSYEIEVLGLVAMDDVDELRHGRHIIHRFPEED